MTPKSKSARNPWPIAIVAFFIGFFLFTVGLVVFASRQKMDLVRGDYYDEEIRYQEQLNRMNLTQQLRTPVVITYERARQLITIELPPDHAQGLASGRIHLYRPADEKLDRDIPLAVNPEGVQRVDAGKLQAGLWKLRLYWTVNGKDYFFDQTVIVEEKAS